MAKAGIAVVIWADSLAVEERVATDLPIEGLDRMFELACELKGDQSARGAVAHRLKRNAADLHGAPSTWLATSGDAAVRQALGIAAKECDWFKQVETGQRLGDIVVQHIQEMRGRDLAAKIAELRAWIERP